MKKYFEKRLFSVKGEAFNLLLPVFFLILVILEYTFRFNPLAAYSKFQISILANIILLNITHNAFTLVLLTSALPLKLWIDHHGGVKKFWFNQSLIIIFLTVFFTQLIYFSTKDKSALILFSCIGFVFAAHHALSQSFGLSLIYTNHVKATAAVVAQKSERILFNLFLFSNLAGGTLFILQQFNLLSASASLINLARYLLTGTICVTGAALVIQPFYFYKKSGVAKGLFNLRYLIWPLTLFSSMAIFATLVIHGMEYAQVIDKMVSKDKLRKPFLGMGIIFVVILFAFLRIEGLGSIRRNNGTALWLFIATGFSFAISFHHYYLDRKLFKMRKPVNREIIGPLLIDESRTGIKNNDR